MQDDSKSVYLYIVFDTANGFTKQMEDAILWFKDSGLYDPYYMITVAGNIASIEGYNFLNELGIDIIRTGIGNGSSCKTSIITGVGAGTISIIEEINNKRSNGDALILADGGIKSSGDVVKALAVGADLVMLGNLLSAYFESPGDLVMDDDLIPYKQFKGMASEDAFNILNEINGTNNKLKVAEGISTLVKYKGHVDDFLHNFLYGIRSGFSYFNSKNFEEFKDYFNSYPDSIVLLSNNSLEERKPIN